MQLWLDHKADLRIHCNVIKMHGKSDFNIVRSNVDTIRQVCGGGGRGGGNISGVQNQNLTGIEKHEILDM